MQVFFVVGWGRGHKLFCEHQRHWPVRGGEVQGTLCFRFAAMRFPAFRGDDFCCILFT